MANMQPSEPAPYTILAGLSFDATGESALYEAGRLTRQTPECDVHVVHVIEEDGPAETDSELASLNQRLLQVPARVQERIEALWSAEPRKITIHVRVGDADRAILQAAVDVDADIIVVGSHRRRGIEQWVQGSVAHRVLRDSHCPVLVAFPKNYEGLTKSQSIEPPCADCVATRQQTQSRQYWCERHSRHYAPPHVYEPSDRAPSHLMPTH
jgi:nucleotide-binding universal stress UspA family protein